MGVSCYCSNDLCEDLRSLVRALRNWLEVSANVLVLLEVLVIDDCFASVMLGLQSINLDC